MTIYQVDAFADKLFSGNPAAVVPLQQWPDDELMQQIAMENNLAETAFFVPSAMEGADYDIRWFMPVAEINLCGHATLASAYVVFEQLKTRTDKVVFHSKSGLLTVTKQHTTGIFTGHMDFPSWKPERTDEYPEELLQCLGNPEIAGVYTNREYIVELMNEDAVKNCRPDFSLMKKVNKMIIITAPGKKLDFVSRFFAPNSGIDEDPVTGSAHSQLIPFWSEKLGKKKMQARQLSPRGGDLYCEQVNDKRVIMGGSAVLFMKGELCIGGEQ